MSIITKKTPYEQKKVYVRFLYVYEGKNARETAQKVMVTEKTMGSWVKEYGWAEMRKRLNVRVFEKLELNASNHNLIGKLRVFLSHKHRNLYKEIEKGIDAFIEYHMTEKED